MYILSANVNVSTWGPQYQLELESSKKQKEIIRIIV